MSDPYRKVREGEPLQFSAQLHNETVDVVRAAKKAGGNKAVPYRPGEGLLGVSLDLWQDLFVTTVNELHGLSHFKTVTNNSSSDWQFQPLLEADIAYSDYHQFDAGSILHRAAARTHPADVHRHYAAGIVPAMIYVHDAAHRFVDVPYMTVNLDGSGGIIQNKYWESDWDGPHQILWKESGTGEKKALLRLGENRPRLLWGVCKEAWRKRGGDYPSLSGKWAYVNVALRDYSSGTAGVESSTTVRVLLPTNNAQDPNCIAGMPIGFMKAYHRYEDAFYPLSWPKFRYAAVTPNYFSDQIGAARIYLTQGGWSCPGWVLADGNQDTDKTRSGEAADADDRFLYFNKLASEQGGANNATFLSKDVIDNIAAHPDHVHDQNSLGGQAGEGGPDPGTIPGIQTVPSGAAGHATIDPDHEVEIDIRPSWQGAQLYERIDNSAGDEE